MVHEVFTIKNLLAHYAKQAFKLNIVSIDVFGPFATIIIDRKFGQ